MSFFAAALVLGITFWVVGASEYYFRQQRRVCRKYDFFRLRDEIVRRIAESDNVDESLMKDYTLVNDAIEALDHFNRDFFGSVIRDHVRFLIADLESFERLQTAERRAAEATLSTLTDFQERFLVMLVDSARANSLVLRLAMSKSGFIVLHSPIIAMLAVRVLAAHADWMWRKVKSDLKTLRTYARLAHLLAA